MDFYIPDNNLFSKRFTILVRKLSGIEVGAKDWRQQLANWVQAHPCAWWQGVWIACEIKGDPGEHGLDDQNKTPDIGEIFSNARINIAENIFTFGPLNDDSLIAWAEDGPRSIWARARLKEMAGRFASAFHELGLNSGDRVVIHLPDVPEKIAAFLGACWMGLVPVIEPPWARPIHGRDTCWAEFSPKLILTCDGYRRDGVWVDNGSFLEKLTAQTKDDLIVVPVPCAGSRRNVQSKAEVMPWDTFDKLGKGGGFSYRYIPFVQELAFLYQNDDADFKMIKSGEWLTSMLMDWLLWVDIGVGAHIFASDIREQSNWLRLIAALATGSDVILYNGDHGAMNGQVLWRIIEREQVKVVHITQKLLAEIQNGKAEPKQNHHLDRVELVIVEGAISTAQKDFLQTSCFVNAKISFC